MVEFKVTAAGLPYVIEVNGRFWGSLQLAVDCGIDFPLFNYLLASSRPFNAPESYPIGRRSRWLLGDLDHLYLVLRAPADTCSASRKIGTFMRFLSPAGRRTRYEVNRLDDMKPFLRELRQYLSR